MKKLIAKLQPIGRALMLPIAVLPVAALLLRLGQPDLLNLPAIAAAGDAIFSNLGLLFALGVAVGLARENHGAAGLAGVVGYLVATQGAKVLIDVPPEITANIPEQFKALVAEAFRAKNSGLAIIYASGYLTLPPRVVDGGLFFTKPYDYEKVLQACYKLTSA